MRVSQYDEMSISCPHGSLPFSYTMSEVCKNHLTASLIQCFPELLKGIRLGPVWSCTP